MIINRVKEPYFVQTTVKHCTEAHNKYSLRIICLNQENKEVVVYHL